MEAPYEAPNILRLQGLSLSAYTPPEALSDRRLRARARDLPRRREPALVTEKVPAVFTGLDTWPSATGLLCWECGFGIEGRPIFAPTYIREGGGGGIEMGVDGLMCSFPCAVLRIETRLRGDLARLWRARDLLQILFFLFTGHALAHPIQAAPERTRLRQYGGDLDESAFRAKIRELDPLATAERRNPLGAAPVALREHRALQMVRPVEPLRLETGNGSMWEACGADGAAPPGAPGAEPPGGRGRPDAKSGRPDAKGERPDAKSEQPDAKSERPGPPPPSARAGSERPLGEGRGPPSPRAE
ncbi:MAG TPA: hypothetical protein VNI01_03675, partial [Elusimicrobiota bacterium]|nr:hypothetical protein [Elusimicrobiota bacterium]